MMSTLHRRLVRFGTVWVLVAAATGSLASEFQTMDAAALKAAVTDKTVRLETQVGTIPISFRADGTMTGRSTDMANYLGRSYDTGTWWVTESQLCQKWKLWMDAKSYCFTLRQNGTKVQWTRDDGLKGVISVVSN